MRSRSGDGGKSIPALAVERQRPDMGCTIVPGEVNFQHSFWRGVSKWVGNRMEDAVETHLVGGVGIGWEEKEGQDGERRAWG